MPAGRHSNPRRKITASREDFERWDQAAEFQGLTWSAWVTRLMDAASKPRRPANAEHPSEKDQESTVRRLRGAPL